MKTTRIDLDGQQMFVVDSSNERAMISNDAPHAHYCLRHEIHCELAAFNRICNRIAAEDPAIRSVIELFGGSGWHSQSIQRFIKPVKHVAVDIEPDCVKSIQMSLPSVEALLGDAYQVAGELKADQYDWVHADFNQFTWKRRKQSSYARALEGIFRGAKKWATVTDSAVYGLARFAKNRQSYAESIGMNPDDWQDYFRATAKLYAERYGYGVRHVVVWHRMSSMLLLKAGAEPEFSVEEVKDKIPVKIIE